jgi:RNA polymerase sigma-70 factor, ECF subfamily
MGVGAEDRDLDERWADKSIQEALARDDPAAVEWLWQRYAGDLLAYLAAMLCSRHDAEDVLQTVFVRMVGKRRKLAKARCLNAYVYRIARNEAASYRRRRHRDRQHAAVREPWLDPPQSGQTHSEIVDLLETALSRLPESQRQVVVMKVYREKTFQEIAQFLEISLNTAASRYRYGMEKLRNLLKEQLP